MSDLRFQQFRRIVHIFNVIVLFAQFGVRYGNRFRIFTRIRRSFSVRQRTAADDDALQQVRRRDQNVYRVAVRTGPMVDVTVVARMKHRGGHEACGLSSAPL